MHDVSSFGVVVCLVAAAGLVAVLSSRISDRIKVPAPALFLIGAAVASDLVPRLAGLSIKVDTRIVTAALIFILFDGGMHIGRARFRTATGAILWVGVAGTAATAAAVAAAAHGIFGFDWRTALLIGTALAPTDPAVVFSVLGPREISGRSGTILEGESGVNDPVGIALIIALLGASGADVHGVAAGVGNFLLQMTVGAVVGTVGGYLLLRLMRHLALPNEALYSLRTLAFAALVYGAATVAHGSGFLAVFLAGILVGDARAPYKREIERFSAGVASLGEIIAFVVLGLSISVRGVLHPDQVGVGIALAALLILVVRPLLVGALLLPIRLRTGERVFVMTAGLKGAVPILLGMFVLASGVPEAHRVYGIIFVVVLVSVALQGALVPALARACGVPMRVVEPEPWALGMRFRDEPQGLQRHVVATGSTADGAAVGDLPLGESAWVSMVSRSGSLLRVRGNTELRAGDEVLLLADDDGEVGQLFRRPS